MAKHINDHHPYASGSPIDATALMVICLSYRVAHQAFGETQWDRRKLPSIRVSLNQGFIANNQEFTIPFPPKTARQCHAVIEINSTMYPLYVWAHFKLLQKINSI